MCRQNSVTDELLVVDIKNSEWIDLSSGHEQVRKSLEKNIENSCVNKMATSPTMVKGAFRIGKTALLSYLFHYSWTTLSVPAFLIDLDDIIIKAKEYLIKNSFLEKIPNKDLNTIVEDILSEPLTFSIVSIICFISIADNTDANKSKYIIFIAEHHSLKYLNQSLYYLYLHLYKYS